MPSLPLDVLAVAAHRDDVEQTCGGTLLKMADLGRRTGILDLTRGEMGTRGTAQDPEPEAIPPPKIPTASCPYHFPGTEMWIERCFRGRPGKVSNQPRPGGGGAPAGRGEGGFQRGGTGVGGGGGGGDQRSGPPPGGHGFSRADHGHRHEPASAA